MICSEIMKSAIECVVPTDAAEVAAPLLLLSGGLMVEF